MSFSSFYNQTIRSYNQDNKGMRLGQFFMNELARQNLEVPDDVDCFHNDDRFPDFVAWLSLNWEKFAKLDSTETDP